MALAPRLQFEMCNTDTAKMPNRMYCVQAGRCLAPAHGTSQSSFGPFANDSDPASLHGCRHLNSSHPRTPTPTVLASTDHRHLGPPSVGIDDLPPQRGCVMSPVAYERSDRVLKGDPSVSRARVYK